MIWKQPFPVPSPTTKPPHLTWWTALVFLKYRLLIVSAATKRGVYLRQHVSAPPATKNLCENRSVWTIHRFKTFGEQLLVSDNRELLDRVNILTRTLQLTTVNQSRLQVESSSTSLVSNKHGTLQSITVGEIPVSGSNTWRYTLRSPTRRIK